MKTTAFYFTLYAGMIVNPGTYPSPLNIQEEDVVIACETLIEGMVNVEL